MPSGATNAVLDQLLKHASPDLSDAELLDRFVVQRDESAFAVLVRRHGPMILGVCRRVTRQAQDAEDAFQATFLILVRKAASIARREALGNWLYGVAQRTALEARTRTARRAHHEQQVSDMPHPFSETDYEQREILQLLDEALSRLPTKYRTPLVLCELQGRTRKAVALELGIPEGTLSSRLAAGRKLLAKRLGRHTTLFSSGLLAAVPFTLLNSTLNAASGMAAGAGTGVVSETVAALVAKGVQALVLARLKWLVVAIALTVILSAGLAGTGLAMFGDEQPTPTMPVTPPQAAAQNQPEQKPEPNKAADKTAWGKAVNGLQAGLRPGEYGKTAFHPGETLYFELVVRNISTEDATLSYWPPSLWLGDVQPDGRLILNTIHIHNGQGQPYRHTLSAGAEWVNGEACSVSLRTRPAGLKESASGALLEIKPGKYKVSVKDVWIALGQFTDAAPLPTGQLEIEILPR